MYASHPQGMGIKLEAVCPSPPGSAFANYYYLATANHKAFILVFMWDIFTVTTTMQKTSTTPVTTVTTTTVATTSTCKILVG